MSGLGEILTVACLTVGAFTIGAFRSRRRAAAEIASRQRAEREAEAARRSHNEILANVSHELRTPMNGVLGMVNLLLTTELPAARRHKALEVIHTSAEGLLALIDDVLDFSEIQSGKLALRSSNFRLRHLLWRVAGLLQVQADEKGLELRLEIDPELPDNLYGDPARLRQVLLNLAGNAVKFTREGEVKIRVEPDTTAVRQTNAKGPGDQAMDGPTADVLHLRFTVRDTGIGISPKDHPRIFAPFTQADTTAAREFGGIGLGLIISKNLVTLMGGEIDFTSTREVGSTFWFRLPLLLARQPVELETPVASGQQLRLLATDAPRVLVVDDNAINRLVSETQLEVLGFRTAVAASGPRALELLAESPFDAVLMDCQMPKLDGYETTRRLRRREEEDGRRSVVIGVTAHATRGARASALAAGMDDYLAKPLGVGELGATLERWLSPSSWQHASGTAAVDATPDTMPDEPGPLATIRQLEHATGKDFLAKTAATFRREGARDLDTIRQALIAGDADALARSAHALGGSSDYLDASTLAQLCDKLESLARKGDLTSCQAHLRALETAFDEVTHELARAAKE